MRFIGALLTAAAVFTLAGCSSLVSLHPFVTGQQAVFDPALVGVWASADENEMYLVRQDGNGYKIRRVENSGTQNFSAHLLKIGDLRILDLVSEADDPFQVAVHTPMRIWVDGATLRFATLDTASLKDQARLQIALEDMDKHALITAPGDVVLRFLTTYGAADDAYDKPVTLQKQP